jgi:ketosteroid isomerase-like protein
MSTTATTTTADVDVVRTGFEAFAKGDLGGFGEQFHEDATWNHRNDDRLGGIHAGREAILEFIVESGRLTEGTLRAAPGVIMGDGEGHVAVTVRVSGTRPDGRTFDDPQILVFSLDAGRVRSVEQYIGDHAAVTAFWA